MEQTREERVQQRLRGASRRPIKEVDFGLSIPAAPLRSSSPVAAAPAINTAPQPPNEPSPSSVLPTLPPPPPTSISDPVHSTPSHSVNDANTSAKRRKLDSDLAPVSSIRSTRSARTRTPRRDPYDFPDDNSAEDSLPIALETDVPVENAEESELLSAVDSAVEATVLGDTVLEDTVLENTVLEDTVLEDVVLEPPETPSVHFAEESTIISIARPTTDDLINELLEDTILSQVTEAQTPIPARKRKRVSLEESPILRAPIEEDEADELSPDQPSRRVSRTKIIVRKPLEVEETGPLSDPVEPEEAESINDQEAATVLSKTKGKRKSVDPASASRGDEVEVSELPKSKRQRKQDRQESNRAEQRQPKRVVSKNTKSARKASSGKRKAREGSPISVTIHRLSRPTVFDEEQGDADILNAEISHRKRAGVNAIDVLRGLCDETAANLYNSLKESQSNSEEPAYRREYATKARAVESYRNEIDIRLVEHTVNLDNAYALERRVRDENKKKLNLREEILRVRAEREKVALRMDDIRTHHENETNSSRELDTLNTAVHDIELAVSRGQTFESDESTIQTPDMCSIEILLKKIAGEVSKKGDSGGLLKQIKDFNGFLERTALALETRRV